MDKPDQFVETMGNWMRIFMHNSMHRAMLYAKECGWSMSQLGTLMVIHRKGSSAVSDIGEEMGISNPAASQMLDRLVQEGLILRTEDPTDRRVKQVQMTEKGLKILHGNLQARQSWLPELANNLTEEEKELISQALDIMIKKAPDMGNIQDAPPPLEISTQEQE